MTHILDFEQRRVEVVWQTAESHRVYELAITAVSDARLFSEIEAAIAKHGGSLLGGALTAQNADSGDGSVIRGTFSVRFASQQYLSRVMCALRRLPAVREVVQER